MLQKWIGSYKSYETVNIGLFFRMEYKNDYERFKFKMTVISMVFTILNLYIFNYRYLDIV